MSYFVTYGMQTEEFSISCGLSDVQAYYGVSMGGLRLHGLGPIIPDKDIKIGEAYELQGTPIGVKILRQVHKNRSRDVVIIEKVEWDLENVVNEENVEIIPPLQGKSSETNVLKRNSRESKGNQSLQQTSIPQIRVQEEEEEETIRWVVVMMCCVGIVFFMLLCMMYLQSYDPNLELVLREDADQMTLVNVSVIAISFLFGIFAFFH